MREIKFRGYSYAKQSWLYGNLIEKEDPTKAEPTPWVRLIHDRALSAELVAFGSVGQFTGLKDKNGKDIYEGDIVKTVFYNHGMPNTEIIQSVSFENGTFTVCSKSVEYEESRRNVPIIWNDEIHVLGNIYENPELLK